MKCDLESYCRKAAIYRVSWKTTLPNGLPLQTSNACEVHGDALHEQMKGFHARAEALLCYEEPCEQRNSKHFTELDAEVLATYRKMVENKEKEPWEWRPPTALAIGASHASSEFTAIGESSGEATHEC